MTNLNGGNIPLLGAQETRGLVPGFFALVRELDENATFKAEQVLQGPQGPVAVAGRSGIVDATELVSWIAEVVRIVLREELMTLLASPPTTVASGEP